MTIGSLIQKDGFEGGADEKVRSWTKGAKETHMERTNHNDTSALSPMLRSLIQVWKPSSIKKENKNRLNGKVTGLRRNVWIPIILLFIFIISSTTIAQSIPQEELRQSLVDNWNTRRFIYGKTEAGQVAIFEISGPLGSSISAKPVTERTISHPVTMIALAWGIVCTPCAVGAVAALTTAAIIENAAYFLWDPFIADVFIAETIIIEGDGDVTDRIIALGQANIVREAQLREGLSVSFIDPSVFSTVLKDASGQRISEILGTDAILLNRGGDSAFGLVAYNDPDLTGRVITNTDAFGLNLSAITSQPLSTEVKYRGMWMVVSEQLPEITSNQFVTLEPIYTTFVTTSDTTGCPEGDCFAGKFSFDAELKNKEGSPALSFPQVQAVVLTNGVLQNADGGPRGARALLTVPLEDALADGILQAGESVQVPFTICLEEIRPFSFFVDVFADEEE